MTEMTEDFKLLKAWKRERHAQWKEDNIAFLHARMAGRFAIRNNGETLIFREPDFPKVDFLSLNWPLADPRGEKDLRGRGREFQKMV